MSELLKGLLIMIMGTLLLWLASAFVPSQSEVDEIGTRQEFVEDSVDEMKQDIRDIKNFLMNGVCHD